MKIFTVENSIFYTTNAKENLTEAQISCSKNSSSVANLSGLNFKEFVEKLKNYQNSNQNYYKFLRVHPVKSSLDDCFGLIDLSWLIVEKELSENVVDVCAGDDDFAIGKFNTLCSRKFDDSLSDISSDACYQIVWIITIVVSVMVGICLIGFFYIKKKRQRRLIRKSSVRQNELLKSSNEVSNYYHFTKVVSTKIYSHKLKFI